MKIKSVEIVGYFLLAAAMAVFAIAEATSFWYIINQSDQDSNFGFWEACNKTFADEITTCQDIGWLFFDNTYYFVAWELMACKILFMVANVFIGIGIVCMIISFLVDSRGPSVVAEGCLFLLAGITGLIGCGIFTIYPSDKEATHTISNNLWNGFGYSYILGWTASGIILVTGMILIVAGNSLKVSAAVSPAVVYVNDSDDERDTKQQHHYPQQTQTPHIYIQQ